MYVCNCKSSKSKYLFYFRWPLYCSHYLCATVQTTHITMITTITIRLLFLCAYNLFASHTCTLFCTQQRCSNTQQARGKFSFSPFRGFYRDRLLLTGFLFLFRFLVRCTYKPTLFYFIILNARSLGVTIFFPKYSPWNIYIIIIWEQSYKILSKWCFYFIISVHR